MSDIYLLMSHLVDSYQMLPTSYRYQAILMLDILRGAYTQLLAKIQD